MKSFMQTMVLATLIVQPALVVSDWCKNIDTRCIDWLIDNSAAVTVRVAEGGAGRFDNRIIDGIVNLFATVAYIRAAAHDLGRLRMPRCRRGDRRRASPKLP